MCYGRHLGILSRLTYLLLEYANAEQCQRFGQLLIAEARKKKCYDYLAKGYIYSGLCQHDKALVEQGLRLLEVAGEQKLWQDMKAYVEANRSEI
ncbi:hypothetical protein [Streptococcus ovuberis]|uniref:Uncharacterized protein n=1 Tax=Streptococcus ovuberis TaxID=1936207 RepID=A0A7X6MX69_9STRE|nr:hypothetical protein [Streptococcus ovuberis]NKZ19581.1 hypothetical protein [Streptococcus ovuberis]